MRNKLLSVLFALMFCICGVANAEGITSFERLILPSYWTHNNNNGDQLMMDAKMIKNFNASVRSMSRTVVNLGSYPTTVSGDSLKTRIMNYQLLDDDLYLNGKKVSNNYKNILRTQTNVSKIPTTVNVRYGVTVRRSNVRNLPTGQSLFFFFEDKEFDALQETALDPCEPVAILHTSANGYFYYVQAYNYSGWVSKFNVALTDRATWMKYVNPIYSLVVTDFKLTVPVKRAKEQIVFQQGARIPMLAKNSTHYFLGIPICKTPGGPLEIEKIPMLKKDIAKYINEGYMPYTSNNIINAAFKNYNAPYGWGGLKDSVDCSSMINNIYRTVGIMLPRNADEQALSAGKHILFENMDNDTRLLHIRNLTPGSVLHQDGHCMMYLGTSDNVPYVIHALGSHYKNGERQSVMSVVVSDLNLTRASGKSYLEEILTTVEYK